MTEVSPKLGGRLPVGDGNGMIDMGYELASNPSKIRAAVILFDCSDVTEKTDSGDRTVKVRVRRIEVIRNPEDFGQMQRLLLREFERRTGKAVLPFELEKDVELAFAEIAETDGDGSKP